MAQNDVDRINKAADDLTKEKEQIIGLVTEKQTALANAVNEINQLKTAGADNEAIVAALNEKLLPAVETAVSEFDALTPDGTPVIE